MYDEVSAFQECLFGFWQILWEGSRKNSSMGNFWKEKLSKKIIKKCKTNIFQNWKDTVTLNLLINSNLHAVSGLMHVTEFINYHTFLWITSEFSFIIENGCTTIILWMFDIFFVQGGFIKGMDETPLETMCLCNSQLPPTDLWTKLACSYIKRPLSYWTKEWRENTAFSSGSKWRRDGQSYNPTKFTTERSINIS